MGQGQSHGNGSSRRRALTVGEQSGQVAEAHNSNGTNRDATVPTTAKQHTAQRRNSTRGRKRKLSEPISRRRAVRKSLLNIVKPRTASEAATSGVTLDDEDVTEAQAGTSDSSGSRSAWRRSIGFVRSRRWSKAPSAHSILHEDDRDETPTERDPFAATVPMSTSSSPSPIAHPPTSSPTTGSSPAQESTDSNVGSSISGSTALQAIPAVTTAILEPEDPSTKEQAVAEQAETSTTLIEPPTPSPQATSANNGEEPSTSIVRTLSAPADDSNVVEPSVSRETPESASGPAIEAASIPRTAPSQGERAPFATPNVPATAPAQQTIPPPGTLVVVQGVVHTTDVQIPIPGAIPQIRSSQPQSQDSNFPDLLNAGPQQPQDEARRSVRTSSSFSSGTRDRLSALIGRRHGSRSSSRPGSAASLPVRDGASIRNDLPSSGESLVGSLFDEDSNPVSTETPSTTPPEAPPQPASRQGNMPGSISSSSIDVLGTLLSVAAAATAASLLTGSSDPVLSSGITSTPPGNENPLTSQAAISPTLSDLPSDPFAASSVSPTIPPRLSTDGGSTAAPSPGVIRPPSRTLDADRGDTARAERMRHMWASVRERLGLGPPLSNRRDPRVSSGSGSRQPIARPTHHSGFGATGTDATAEAGSGPVDRRGSGFGSLADSREARERMFNEMARAFNLGFGLPPASANAADDAEELDGETERGEGGEAEETLPSEGTFERFLVDLQVDLRGVLTGEGIGRQQTREQPTEETGSVPASLDTPRLDEPEPEDNEVEDEDEDEDVEEDDTGSMPSLHAVPDSDDSDLDSDSDSESIHATSEPSDAIPPVASTAVSSNDTEDTPAPSRPRVNYWRLYRFPAIAAPRAQAAAESVVQNMRSGIGGLTRASPTARNSESPASPSAPQPATTSEPETGSAPVPAEAPASMVIPVIVVGLQSVNVLFGHEPPDAIAVPSTVATSGTNLPEVSNGESVPAASLMDDTQAGAEADATRSGSRWPSRAANALRTLRRQSAPSPATSALASATASAAAQNAPAETTSQGTQTQSPTGPQTHQNRGLPAPFPDILSTPGSRTFLIYVIGGYYPPDHEIFAGTNEGGNLSSSFEALLSLPELLTLLHTQPTPPTASKDQIENSGLEVITGGQVEEWEKQDKIRSNCIERCLICLDEYQQEDSVRVLECKHAFHMDCVDRWLVEGRNSCPACRGKGVSESEDVPS